MRIELQLGTCAMVNALLREDVQRIAGDVVVRECPEVAENDRGMKEICGTELRVDGTLVAAGYEQIRDWLNEHHHSRVRERMVHQLELATAAG